MPSLCFEDRVDFQFELTTRCKNLHRSNHRTINNLCKQWVDGVLGSMWSLYFFSPGFPGWWNMGSQSCWPSGRALVYATISEACMHSLIQTHQCSHHWFLVVTFLFDAQGFKRIVIKCCYSRILFWSVPVHYSLFLRCVVCRFVFPWADSEFQFFPQSGQKILCIWHTKPYPMV